MITLTKSEQAGTFLGLLALWHVGELDNVRDVQRHTVAEVTSYFQPLARRVYSVADMLRQAMADQEEDARHKHWRADFDDLVDAVGSKTIARLALGVVGLWPTRCQETGAYEWSDCEIVGGARNDLQLPSQLTGKATD